MSLTRFGNVAVWALSMIAVLVVGARDSGAQSQASTSADSTALVHEVTVTTPNASITVGRSSAERVHLIVRTDSGTFTLVADSAALALWADSVATLPDPPTFVADEPVSFKVWGVKADGDSGAHMRFARMPTTHGTDLALALSNGVWADIEYLGPQGPEVLAALRGDSSAFADTAHVKANVGPAIPRLACLLLDWSARRLSAAGNPACLRRRVKDARQKGGSHGPEYPPSLALAGKDGKALLSFVIDTTGQADPRSIRLIKSTNPLFAIACRNALSRMEFLPAQVDGHKVSELVQLPFTFTALGYPDFPEPTM
jgi:TonB family protein